MNAQKTTAGETWKKMRWVITLTLGGLLGVFALQNVQRVELTFLLWTFESRRIVVIGVSVCVGLAIGWVLGRPWERHRPKKAENQ